MHQEDDRVQVKASGQQGIIVQVKSKSAWPYVVYLDHGQARLYQEHDLVKAADKISHVD